MIVQHSERKFGVCEDRLDAIGNGVRDAVGICSGQSRAQQLDLRRWESELRMTEEQVLAGDREAQPIAEAVADTTDDTVKIQRVLGHIYVGRKRLEGGENCEGAARNNCVAKQSVTSLLCAIDVQDCFGESIESCILRCAQAIFVQRRIA